ncbi:MAG: hypothetical protein NTZ17_08695 [Phycisphaerae bacterium]|nr:hypothetical protein [Phycisphaerae bacterium]
MKNVMLLVALSWLLAAPVSPAAAAGDPNAVPGDFPEFIITQNGETALMALESGRRGVEEARSTWQFWK